VSNCRSRLIALFLSALVLLTSTPAAFAVGYWNVPGTYVQYIGYGMGPGHHVPMVLGPVRCDGWLGVGVRRLPSAPSAWPSASCGNAAVPSDTPLFQTTRLP
jgi:hypothetical protein